MKWQKATLQQLQQIIHFEKCPIVYKCFAEAEVERRLKESGYDYPV
ncbi:hypothetical protein [Priestia flexa]|jgi:hypothetical protein